MYLKNWQNDYSYSDLLLFLILCQLFILHSQHKNFAYFISYILVLYSYLLIFRTNSWLCSKGSLLEGLGDEGNGPYWMPRMTWVGCLKNKCLLCYYSNPMRISFTQKLSVYTFISQHKTLWMKNATELSTELMLKKYWLVFKRF